MVKRNTNRSISHSHPPPLRRGSSDSKRRGIRFRLTPVRRGPVETLNWGVMSPHVPVTRKEGTLFKSRGQSYWKVVWETKKGSISTFFFFLFAKHHTPVHFTIVETILGTSQVIWTLSYLKRFTFWDRRRHLRNETLDFWSSFGLIILVPSPSPSFFPLPSVLVTGSRIGLAKFNYG